MIAWKHILEFWTVNFVISFLGLTGLNVPILMVCIYLEPIWVVLSIVGVAMSSGPSPYNNGCLGCSFWDLVLFCNKLSKSLFCFRHIRVLLSLRAAVTLKIIKSDKYNHFLSVDHIASIYIYKIWEVGDFLETCNKLLKWCKAHFHDQIIKKK